jgi:hypothetical protein
MYIRHRAFQNAMSGQRQHQLNQAIQSRRINRIQPNRNRIIRMLPKRSQSITHPLHTMLLQHRKPIEDREPIAAITHIQ